MTTLRVAAAATDLSPVASPQQWVQRIQAQARFARDGGAQLVVFAEYAAAPLLAIDNHWPAWEKLWRDTIQQAAQTLNLAICGGTWPCQVQNQLHNRALLALPNGQLHWQSKLHATPWERQWQIADSSELLIIHHAHATLAILTCYDIEFPEAARAAVRAGANMLIVPSWTDDQHGFHRVRHCAHARCIENGVAVIHAPLVGHLAVPGFEQASGTAGILTPCDTGYAANGLAAAGTMDHPNIILADIDLARLHSLRNGGTVTPLRDARAEISYRTLNIQSP